MCNGKLFKEKEIEDKSLTAISERDTHIQKMSKLFARNTVLEGKPQNLMIAYQQGAKDIKPHVIKVLCINCPSKEDCYNNNLCTECDSYNSICKIFDE